MQKFAALSGYVSTNAAATSIRECVINPDFWRLADFRELISPQHFDDMPTTRQTGLLTSGRQTWP